jgi:hypothetical protein
MSWKSSDRNTLLYWLFTCVAMFLAALFVLGIPPDPRISLTSHLEGRTSDAIQSAIILETTTRNLLTRPLQYSAAPYLYPLERPLGSTNPLLGEALLALPIRLVVGESPILLYNLVRWILLAFLGLFSVLFLREIGLPRPWATAGGMTVLLIPTTFKALDNIQDFAFCWLLLGLWAVVRSMNESRPFAYVVFAGSVFLFLTGTFYFAAAIFGLVLLSLPAVLVMVLRFSSWRRVGVLGLAGLAGAGIGMAALLPWFKGYGFYRYFLSPEFLEVKRWGAFKLAGLVASPVEYQSAWIGWWPAPVNWGMFRLAAREKHADNSIQYHLYRAAAVVQMCSAVLLSVIIGWSLFTRPLDLFVGTCFDIVLIVLLTSWFIRLAFWPRDSAFGSRWWSSAGFHAATIFLFLATGSPVHVNAAYSPLGEGIFSATAQVARTLLSLRETGRIILPAGVMFALALVIALSHAAHRREGWLSLVLAALLPLGMFAERIGSTPGVDIVPPAPEYYRLALNKPAEGALLELPMPGWNSRTSILRMHWQRGLGRPIVSGYLGYPPPYYGYAHDCFSRFPAPDAVALLRAWNIPSALIDTSSGEGAAPDRLPPGVEVRATGDGAVLYDILPHESSLDLGQDAVPLSGETISPDGVRTLDGMPLPGATDGAVQLRTAALASAGGLEFIIPRGRRLAAAVISFGAGYYVRAPRVLSLQALIGGEWRDITAGSSGRAVYARLAWQLVREPEARIVIRSVLPSAATRFRLVAERPWHVPELTVVLEAIEDQRAGHD